MADESKTEETAFKWGATTQPSSQLREYSLGHGASLRVRTERAEAPVDFFISIPGIVQENARPILVGTRPGTVYGKVKNLINDDAWLSAHLVGKNPDWLGFVDAIVKVVVQGSNGDLLAKRENAVIRLKERLQKAQEALVKAEQALEEAKKSNGALPRFEMVMPEKIEPQGHRTRKAQNAPQNA